MKKIKSIALENEQKIGRLSVTGANEFCVASLHHWNGIVRYCCCAGRSVFAIIDNCNRTLCVNGNCERANGASLRIGDDNECACMRPGYSPEGHVPIADTGAKPTAGQMRTWLNTNDDNNGHLDKGKRRYNVLKWHIINESNRRVYLGIYISLSPFDASSWHSKPQLKMLLFVLNVLHDDQSQCIQWTFEPFELFHSHSDRTMYVSHAIHASQLHALHARTPERLQTVWIFMYNAFFDWSLVWIVRGEQEFVHVACMPHLTNTA